MEDIVTKIGNWFDSSEGKKAIDKMVVKLAATSNSRKRFYEKFKGRFPELIEKCLAKYGSSEYIKRWHRQGIEPEEFLLWEIFHIAEVYGRKASNFEVAKYAHDNPFAVEILLFEGYVFVLMYGQGSALDVIPEEVKRYE